MCNELIKKGKARGSKNSQGTAFIWFCKSSGMILRDNVYWARIHESWQPINISKEISKFRYALVSTANWTNYIAHLNKGIPSIVFIISFFIHLSEPMNPIQSVPIMRAQKSQGI